MLAADASVKGKLHANMSAPNAAKILFSFTSFLSFIVEFLYIRKPFQPYIILHYYLFLTRIIEKNLILYTLNQVTLTDGKVSS